MADVAEHTANTAPESLSASDRRLALADLAEHPHSSALQVAARIGRTHAEVYAALKRAERDGQAQRTKPGKGTPWHWEAIGGQG